MTSVRAAKSKGSQFEMDCAYSLKIVEPSIRRIGQEGFQLQYDLESDTSVFECKRLKSLSWKQAKKYFEKLEDKAEGKNSYLLFKSNQQPCLVMLREKGDIIVIEFKDFFGVPFLKHPSMRKQQ